MTTRPGVTRNSNAIKASVSTGLNKSGQQSIAAKEADIKRFSEVMNAKKESEKRNSRDSINTRSEYKESVQTKTSVQPFHGVAATSVHHQQTTERLYSNDTNGELPEQSTNQTIQKTHVGTIAIQETQSAQANKSLQSIVAIIDRIMASVKENAASKVWTIEIALDLNSSFNLELQHHGKNEWSLMIDPDESNSSNQGRSSVENPLENLAQFTDALSKELAKTRPHVKLHTTDAF